MPRAKRAPREAPPPSRWGKSKSGIYVEVIYTGRRNRPDQKKLYALRGLQYFVTGRTEYTLAELNDLLRWLKNKPSAAQIRNQR